jgi:hypothetical protein
LPLIEENATEALIVAEHDLVVGQPNDLENRDPTDTTASP